MAKQSAPAAQQQQAPAPGSRYGLPGLTLFTEQLDNNNGVVVALNQAQQVQFQGLDKFKQTDVVLFWEFEFSWTNTVVNGTSTVTTSPYFPFNIIGESNLKIQNMYSTWHPLSGIDAYIWQLIRPMRPAEPHVLLADANPTGALASEKLSTAAGSAQANLNGALNITSATAAINFTLEVPASVAFEVYYDLSVDGRILSQPHRALVSPQYMAGSSRVITPQILVNPTSAATLDNGPYNVGAGTGTATGSLSLVTRRVGIYSNNDPSTLPVVYNWQYLRESSAQGLGGVSRKDLPLPEYGQIMSIFVRLFDPAANGGLGAPIALSQVTVCRVEFGSGLYRYQDTPKSMQRRFMKQHGVLLPEGVLAWDLATDEWGRTTNAELLNTLTTSGIQVHLEFAAPLSATAYAVLGVEALTFVA